MVELNSTFFVFLLGIDLSLSFPPYLSLYSLSLSLPVEMPIWQRNTAHQQPHQKACIQLLPLVES